MCGGIRIPPKRRLGIPVGLGGSDAGEVEGSECSELNSDEATPRGSHTRTLLLVAFAHAGGGPPNP